MGCAQVTLGSASPAKRALAVLLVAMALVSGVRQKGTAECRIAGFATGEWGERAAASIEEERHERGRAEIRHCPHSRP
jgi:hypothetical protein